MEALSAIEAFVRSAELKSFSAAARRLALSPAAVSKSVAKLEASLGVRLFQRTTRTLTLTEAGEQLFDDAANGLGTLQSALERVSDQKREPVGTLRVSLAPSFGRDYVVPMLRTFLEACPRVTPDWSFETRQVDLIGEGFDAAIGAGLELGAGIVARELARIHIIAVASKDYLAGKKAPKHPDALAEHAMIGFKSSRTGKLRAWELRNADGERVTVNPSAPRILVNDPEIQIVTAAQGHGISLVPTSHALPYLESKRLVRVLPGWSADAGPLLVYFGSQRHLPSKTRAFVDHVVAHFKKERLAARFRAD